MKYALVTGGTKGIGRATVERLLAEGYFVYVNYATDAMAAEAFAKECCSKGWQMECIQADISRMDEVRKIVDLIIAKEVVLDVLVLNAGVTDYAPFGSVSWEVWEKIMNTNLNMPFFLVQGLRDCIAHKGSITLISSVMGNYPHGRSVPYGVSKAGVIYLAKLLVKEFSDKAVRINAVSPGFTETDMQKGKEPDHRLRIENKIGLHRFAEAEEIADMVLAVIHNSYINGANVEVDGGYSCF